MINLPLVVCLFLLTCFWALALPSADREITPQVLKEHLTASAALLYDPGTGSILYERDIDTPYRPASTTKLMTALLVYEMKGMAGSVVIQPEDTHVEPSSVPLIAGEVVSVSDLMHALLISSDNDAALALARYVGGTAPHFMDLMNARARAIGCENTHFVNPNGLPADNHYTTARDLRRIFNLVISIPALREICQTKEYTIRTKAGIKNLSNHNKLLGKFPGMGPAKTGWTYISKHTYAAAVVRDGRELQLVLMHSEFVWEDAKLLFTYGFTHLPTILPSPLKTVQSLEVSQGAGKSG